MHYKQKDLWYKCLVLIATAFHWFNPIVYLIAKAIDIQCELSCDEKVVRGTNADIRVYYSETIIGVVRQQYKRKTALSTNFYGGKKGMKNRFLSIMDMSKKKVGVAVLCAALLLTLGTGVVFATSALSPNGTVQKSQTGQQNSVGVMDKQAPIFSLPCWLSMKTGNLLICLGMLWIVVQGTHMMVFVHGNLLT